MRPTLTEPPELITDDEAIAAFYRREHEAQVRRAFLMVGSAATAHDVVADAFAAVIARWDRIDDPGPYLNRCVLNACRDEHRRRERRAVPVSEPELLDSDGHVDPVDEMAAILLGLPFRQRAAIVLRFYGGHSEREIAEILECRPGTVASAIHRGLDKLRNQMHADPEGGWS